MASQYRAAGLTGCAVTALLIGASIAPATADAGGQEVQSVAASGPTEPETTEPETTEPETTEPETETTGPETVEGEDSSDDTTVAIIAVVAFAALIGVASWWMVRRNDEDDAPHPRRVDPDNPLPGQDLF